MASSGKREDGDGLPKRVDADEALRQLIVPTSLPGYHAGLARGGIGQSYNLLRSRPGQQVPVREFYSEVFTDSRYDRELPFSPQDWFRECVAPYLGRLPGTRSEGGRWVFDPSEAERDALPPSVLQPTEESADDLVRNADFPGRVPATSIQHYQTVTAIYAELRETWTLSRAEVCAHYEPNSQTSHENGEFVDREQWYAVVGYAALEQLPDVEPPVMPEGNWRYIGLGEANEQLAEQPAENGEHQ